MKVKISGFPPQVIFTYAAKPVLKHIRAW